MTISTLIRKTIAAGDGVTTAFNFAFQVRSAADLQVYYTDATGTQTLLAAAAYGVVLNPIPTGQLWSPGGTITYPLVGAAIAAGTKLTIVRNVDLLQSSSLINQGGYFSDVVEAALDVLTMEVQQVNETIARALTLPISSSASTALPSPLANAIIGWDPTGTFITNVIAAGSVPLPLGIGSGGTGQATAVLALAALGGAPLASPAFTGNPTAPTQAANDSSTKLATTAYADAASTKKNYMVNGSLAVNQQVTPGTTDNSYVLDGVRLLLEAANAATAAQDTVDVPTGAGFALKITVGAGNNNKFGILMPIPNKDMLDTRNSVVSAIVALKATAGLTDGIGKIKIGILQWTGTADGTSADPINVWGVEGTNPTLNAGWTYLNAPVALAVAAAAWGDFTAVNAAVGAGANNLALFIWSDDKVTTAATDILRIGGYVTMCKGAAAPAPQVAKFDAELDKCKEQVFQTFIYGTAPAQNVGLATGELSWQSINGGATSNSAMVPFGKGMLTTVAATITLFNPSAANAQVRDTTNAVDCAASTTFAASERGLSISATGNAASTSGAFMRVHLQVKRQL